MHAQMSEEAKIRKYLLVPNPEEKPKYPAALDKVIVELGDVVKEGEDTYLYVYNSETPEEVFTRWVKLFNYHLIPVPAQAA